MLYSIRTAAIVFLACTPLLLTGCGDATGRPQGKVMLKGQPVAGAEIVFQSEANPDAPVTGLSGAGGEYTLDYAGRSGVPAGKCKVTITHHTLRNGKPLPEGEEGATLKSDPSKSVRNVYVFDRDIPAGGGTLDFELSEGKKSVETE
jgi:hypothetical protein